MRLRPLGLTVALALGILAAPLTEQYRRNDRGGEFRGRGPPSFSGEGQGEAL